MGKVLANSKNYTIKIELSSFLDSIDSGEADEAEAETSLADSSKIESGSQTETLASMARKMKYPTNLAPRGTTKDDFLSKGGQKFTVEDPYRFLEDPDAMATRSWVEAENQITEGFLAKCDLK